MYFGDRDVDLHQSIMIIYVNIHTVMKSYFSKLKVYRGTPIINDLKINIFHIIINKYFIIGNEGGRTL